MTAQGFTQTIKEFAGAFKSQITAPDNRSFLFKIFLVIAIYVFLILNSLHDLMSPEHVPECVKDKMQDLTLPINEFLENNVFYKRSLIIAASGMMDINVFALSVTWMCYEKSYKQFFIILFFYIFRGFLQSVFFLRFPTNYIWSDPGIFSIAVPYFPANDFFFSGHVGLCTVCFIYFTREKMTKMKYFALATIVVEFFTLLVTRAHYFIDLVIGLIVAHYIYLCVDWVYEWRDKWLMEWRAKNKAPEGLELAKAEKEKLLDKEKESIKN